ncbi:MAG: hypothetical protein ACR652_16450 [Methylocystis sp.]|uniref:hypothetical protein n=1 Tax=Methylocystis sp. TaxID=1911079 RepID=UPI003DA689CA
MKKLSLVAIATVLAAPAFAGDVGVSVGPNFSSANGVNIGSVTNIGVNNLGAVVQNVGVVGGGVVHLDREAINQERARVDIDPGAFTIGSIVHSGNGGDGGHVDVVAVNIAAAASRNDIDQGGLAAGVAIPVAVAAQGVALQDADHNGIPVNLGVGLSGRRGGNEAEAGAKVGAVQVNAASQRSFTGAVASQDGIGNGIDANGGRGSAFIVTIDSNNTHIDNTSVSKIEVNSTVNVANRGGVAGGLKIEDSFNTADFTKIDVTKINDSFNGNAIAVDDSAALAFTANGNTVGGHHH